MEVQGLCISTKDNRVSMWRTARDNSLALVRGHRQYFRLRDRTIPDFQPDLIITDFEPMTAHIARHLKIPLITLDNQHLIRNVRIPCPPHLHLNMLLAKMIIHTVIPKPDLSLVLTYYFGEVKNDRTVLFPPIINEEVLDLSPSEGDSVLVYLLNGYERFMNSLRSIPRQQFIIYGLDRNGTEGNLVFRPYGRENFLADLAASRAVIATAGFTLISEAVHLGKPYLGIPYKHQFEQEINAHLLKMLGYGESSQDASREDILDFLDRLPRFRDRLKTRQTKYSNGLFASLDKAIADLAG
ncbi:MAG: hypothetical protein JSV00_10350 [bacterium]|nr:MAG: hypothetical protein JSV00_10350 [bacterium]